MPALTILNRKAAAVATCDGLDFVFRTATPLTMEQIYVHYHTRHAARKPLV